MFLNENNDNTMALLNDEEGFDNFDDSDHEEANDTVDFACQVIQRKHESLLKQCEQNERDQTNLPIVMEEDESSRSNNRLESSKDGAILKDEETDFDNANNISPIPKITEVSICDVSTYTRDVASKRKRYEIDESVDNISMMSESSKKLKLSRTGSITRTLKRRMSFGIVTPISNMFTSRSRRNSVDQDLSSCSTATFNSTFNESIKEPIKEKFRQMKEKVCKMTTPKSSRKKFVSSKDKTPEKFPMDGPNEIFKTPKAPMTRARAKLDDSIRHADVFNDTLNATMNATLNVTTTDKKWVWIASCVLYFISDENNEKLMQLQLVTNRASTIHILLPHFTLLWRI